MSAKFNFAHVLVVKNKLKTGLTPPFLGVIGGTKEVEAGSRVSFLFPIFLGRVRPNDTKNLIKILTNERNTKEKEPAFDNFVWDNKV